MQEAELLEGLKQGDTHAFQWLLDNYRQKVVATCYGFTSDYEIALDIAQEVFIEVYRSINDFRGDSKISTWIFRISTNKSLNWLRDNKKHKNSRSIQRFFNRKEETELEIKSTDNSDGQRMMEQNDDNKIIQWALNKLPKNQKKAFVLNKIDDLSYKEVAEIMDVSLSTIESLIFRARKNLQNFLKDYYLKRNS